MRALQLTIERYGVENVLARYADTMTESPDTMDFIREGSRRRLYGFLLAQEGPID